MMREETLKKYPKLRNILEKISGKISDEEMYDNELSCFCER